MSYYANVTCNYLTPSSSSSAMSCKVIDDSSPPTEEDDSNGNYISDTCSDSNSDDSDSDLSSQDPLTLNKTNPLALLERIPLITDVDPACVKEILAYHALNPPTHKDGDREYQVSLTYTMCRYDKALYYGQLSPWCAAFSNRELLVLEYIDDLLYYYKDGYGYEINWKQACNPVVDVAKYFDSIVAGVSTKPYGVFYFSHSGAMAKLLARWGFYNDTMAPTASNFAYQSGRQWSTSRMQNFGVNMVFVLFRCELNTYKVQLYVNERLTHIPGCAQDTCLFSEFAAIVKPIIETCDLDAICENPPAYYSHQQK